MVDKMGEWMAVPGAEELIAVRASRFSAKLSRFPRKRDHLAWDVFVWIGDKSDVANLDDVEDIEEEIPLTDDGF